MTYPGDTKLSEAIQERVQSTYKQSRDLARQGKGQEATLGCEFILRLDPLFEPARKLMQQIEAGEPLAAEPEEGAGSAPPEAAATSAEAAAPAPETDVGAPSEEKKEKEEDDGFDLRHELESLLDVRDFRTLMSVAEEHRDRVVGDPELSRLVASANERLEAEPYVRSFVESAEKAQRQGRQEEALSLLEKARALDPSHPGLPAAKYKPVEDEGNERIRELLSEGQRALERGDYQGAIDSWSRIFLIDIDHGEANRRIEDARRQKAENERKVEEAFHEGVSLWELGTTDKAREQFEKVLALDASHSGAREYIDRMVAREARESSSGFDVAEPSEEAEILAPPDADAPPAAPPPAETEEFGDLLDLDDEGARAPAAAGPRLGRFGSRRFLTIGAGVVLLLAVVFAALYWKRDVFFPNSGDEAPTVEVDFLQRARQLHESGSTVMAIAQLKQLPTDHPQYAEAQALIAQWEAPVEEEVEPAGPSPEDLARRDLLVSRAQEARQRREYLRATELYDRAAQIAPLEEPDQLLHAEVKQRLAGLENEIELFRQGDWEFVLPELWRLHAANPEDKDVVRLMVDSYYNLGVRDLQRGQLPPAEEKFTRALELDPEDVEVARLLSFAQTYQTRRQDLLYRIFVKYLRFR